VIKLSNAEYHANTDSVSKSMLDKIHKAPACLRDYLDCVQPEPTTAMQFGTVAHTAVLEPEKLICGPDIDRRTKAGKAAAEAFCDKYAEQDVVIVGPDVYYTLMEIAESVRRHPVAARILAQGEAEMSAFGIVEDVRCKARPDWYDAKLGICLDLKTCRGAGPSDFARSVANYRYHVQAAFYTDVMAADGFPIESFVFVAVESAPPFLVGVYVLDSEALEVGRAEYQQDLALYRECVESGTWPGLSERIELITLPAFYKRRESCDEWM
jgi:exodeoxyribonuclease VIII